MVLSANFSSCKCIVHRSLCVNHHYFTFSWPWSQQISMASFLDFCQHFTYYVALHKAMQHIPLRSPLWYPPLISKSLRNLLQKGDNLFICMQGKENVGTRTEQS